MPFLGVAPFPFFPADAGDAAGAAGLEGVLERVTRGDAFVPGDGFELAARCAAAGACFDGVAFFGVDAATASFFRSAAASCVARATTLPADRR